MIHEANTYIDNDNTLFMAVDTAFGEDRNVTSTFEYSNAEGEWVIACIQEGDAEHTIEEIMASTEPEAAELFVALTGAALYVNTDPEGDPDEIRAGHWDGVSAATHE